MAILNDRIPTLEPTAAVITRTPEDDGWRAGGYYPRVFKDDDHGGSSGCYVVALNYTEAIYRKSKRKSSTKREHTLVKRKNRQGVEISYIRITRPTGGYKFFPIPYIGTPPNHTVHVFNIQDVCRAASIWFSEEKEKCMDRITLKNIAVTTQKRKARHSLLTAGFLPTK